MINWLHTFSPQPVLLAIGPVTIYWYGLMLVLAMLVGILVAVKLAKLYKIKSEVILDLSFWLLIGGLVGARLYHIGLEWTYYSFNPWDIFKIWQGGLAIHGGIIAGLIVLIIFAKRRGLNFWLLSSIVVPALAFGQAIGRWGNYFNQELFGFPTNLPWGIPINPANVPVAYVLNSANSYFHPTFLYESLFCLLLGAFLVLAHRLAKKEKNLMANLQAITLSYLIFYSVGRFILEEIKIDPTPMVGVLRWPQAISLVVMIIALLWEIVVFRQVSKKSRNT
ncbi:MAG: prolipoprotein diacylglyceryl transferase [Ignavibacteria bacterium]|nr:prolipoprotein diacylglyceryl transferase [Ignavibacteria bacterium]